MMFLDYYMRCLHIFAIKDLFEILIISSGLYYFSLWLKEDKQKPLLFSFYGYCLLFFTTHYTNLTTINTLLIGLFPVTIIGSILLHQTTLQKNFISLYKIHPKIISPHKNWIDTLMQISLLSLSNNKRLYCVIEKNDPLETIIQTPIPFNSPLTEEIFTLFMHSSQFDPYKILWINNQGIMKGINSLWKKNSIEHWLAQEIQEQEELAQDALFFSTKSDLLFFCADPTTRSFKLIHNGSLQENLSTSLAVFELKNYFKHIAPIQGDTYVNTYQKNKPFEQLHS